MKDCPGGWREGRIWEQFVPQCLGTDFSWGSGQKSARATLITPGSVPFGVKLCLLRGARYFDSLWLLWWCAFQTTMGVQWLEHILVISPGGLETCHPSRSLLSPPQDPLYSLVNVHLCISDWRNKCCLCVQLDVLQVPSLPWSHVWILLVAVLEFSLPALDECLVDGQGLLLPGGMSKGDLFRDADWSGILTSLNHLFFFFPFPRNLLTVHTAKKTRGLSLTQRS